MSKQVNKNFSDKKELKFSALYAIIVGVGITLTIQIVQGFVILPALIYNILYHVLLPLAFFCSAIASIILLMAWFKISKEEIISWLQKPTSFKNFGLGILIFLLALPFAEFLTGLIPTDIPILKNLYESFEVSFTMMLDYKIAAFITVCILAPILEEIIFRGFVLRGMLQNKVNPIVAIIMSGLIFGAAHLNPWQFIGAGFLGIVFGYIYYRTKSLILCIFLHALNNILSFVLMVKYEKIEENVFDESATSPIFICLILSILAAYFLTKTTTKPEWN